MPHPVLRDTVAERNMAASAQGWAEEVPAHFFSEPPPLPSFHKGDVWDGMPLALQYVAGEETIVEQLRPSTCTPSCPFFECTSHLATVADVFGELLAPGGLTGEIGAVFFDFEWFPDDLRHGRDNPLAVVQLAVDVLPGYIFLVPIVCQASGLHDLCPFLEALLTAIPAPKIGKGISEDLKKFRHCFPGWGPISPSIDIHARLGDWGVPLSKKTLSSSMMLPMVSVPKVSHWSAGWDQLPFKLRSVTYGAYDVALIRAVYERMQVVPARHLWCPLCRAGVSPKGIDAHRRMHVLRRMVGAPSSLSAHRGKPLFMCVTCNTRGMTDGEAVMHAALCRETPGGANFLVDEERIREIVEKARKKAEKQARKKEMRKRRQALALAAKQDAEKKPDVSEAPK